MKARRDTKKKRRGTEPPALPTAESAALGQGGATGGGGSGTPAVSAAGLRFTDCATLSAGVTEANGTRGSRRLREEGRRAMPPRGRPRERDGGPPIRRLGGDARGADGLGRGRRAHRRARRLLCVNSRRRGSRRREPVAAALRGRPPSRAAAAAPASVVAGATGSPRRASRSLGVPRGRARAVCRDAVRHDRLGGSRRRFDARDRFGGLRDHGSRGHGRDGLRAAVARRRSRPIQPPERRSPRSGRPAARAPNNRRNRVHDGLHDRLGGRGNGT